MHASLVDVSSLPRKRPYLRGHRCHAPVVVRLRDGVHAARMTQMDFSGYQNEIYLGGLAGQQPELPISYADLETRAKEVLTPEAYGYVAGGAGSEDTMRQNLEAFRRWRIGRASCRERV